jgi:polar amino acid transport system substrate-binding protein
MIMGPWKNAPLPGKKSRRGCRPLEGDARLEGWVPQAQSWRILGSHKLLVTLPLAAALVLPACGGSSKAGTITGTSSGTITSGVLVVGSDMTYPPYEVTTGNTPSGFDIDFVGELAKIMNVKLVFKDARISQLIVGLDSKRYDMLATAMYVSPARAKQVDFVPYFDTGNSIVVKSGGSQSFGTLDDLCGHVVNVQQGTVIGSLLSSPERKKACASVGKSAISVKFFPSGPEAAQALLAGQGEAYMTDAAVSKSQVDQSGGSLAISSKTLIAPVTAGIGVAKGNTALLNAIRAGLDAMEKSGRYDELLKKYNISRVDPAVLEASLKGGS